MLSALANQRHVTSDCETTSEEHWCICHILRNVDCDRRVLAFHDIVVVQGHLSNICFGVTTRSLSADISEEMTKASVVRIGK